MLGLILKAGIIWYYKFYSAVSLKNVLSVNIITHKRCAKFLNLKEIKQNYFKLANYVYFNKKLWLSIVWNTK